MIFDAKRCTKKLVFLVDSFVNWQFKYYIQIGLPMYMNYPFSFLDHMYIKHSFCNIPQSYWASLLIYFKRIDKSEMYEYKGIRKTQSLI